VLFRLTTFQDKSKWWECTRCDVAEWSTFVLIRIGTHDLEIILHTTIFSYHDMEVLTFSSKTTNRIFRILTLSIVINKMQHFVKWKPDECFVMLNVENKPFLLSVIMPSVIWLSIMAHFEVDVISRERSSIYTLLCCG
jgi:hypothetical protein